jgi:serine-type D-Ala-D-Ala carboxypeptidase/endopeptidase (penicillin-binding protein 4)
MHEKALRAAFVSLTALIALAIAPVQAAQGLPETVTKALARGKVPATGFSAFVQEIGSERTLLAHNADAPRNPASAIKLVTTFAGLEALGPAYTWRTSAYGLAEPRAGVLEGDLFLKGYGDPFLVLERYWLLVRELRGRGVREIRGDVVIDNSYFDVGNIRPGDFDGRPYNPYNVVPDAMLVNFQAVKFTFRPDPVGRRVEIRADPLPANLTIRNQIQLVDGKCGAKANRIGFTVADRGDHDEATFTGRFSRLCREYEVTRSLMNGPDYAYGLFRTLWLESGGTLRGGGARRTVPSDAKLLASLESVPLADVVSSINKFSNNVMARHLLLTLGAERFGPPATVEKGQRAIRGELERLGLPMPELEVGNGAGLARDTRISTRSLGRVLLAAAKSPFAAEFQSSLAIAGVDGTVGRRYRREAFAKHMHLKTGTLNGVRSMAGYVQAASGRRYAVAMIQNANGWGDEAQNALLRWVYAQ